MTKPKPKHLLLRPGRKPKKIVLPHDVHFFTELYNDWKVKVRTIARVFDCHRDTVTYNAHRLGLTIRPMRNKLRTGSP